MTSADEFSATTVLETLKSEVAQGQMHGFIGWCLVWKIIRLLNQKFVTAPLTSGDLIVGWFTREGDQVDFDDFFLFADHFGTARGNRL